MASNRVSEGTLNLVLDQIIANSAITSGQIADNLGLRPSTIYAALLMLENRKLIQRHARGIWNVVTRPSVAVVDDGCPF